MLNRRELITALLGWQVATTVGCSRRTLPAAGELLRTNFRAGHQLRDRNHPKPGSDASEETGVVIVGGGIAGLASAWRFLESDFEDFVLLELEDAPGGTARAGRNGRFAYPWGAHYVPVPMTENRAFIRLLDEMGLVERYLADGSPVIAEQYLCRDPHERLFYEGQWHEGVYPSMGASDDDLRQLEEFRTEIDRWVEARDDAGRRMFAIPMATGSDCNEVRELDQISMQTWMEQRRWDSARLRWMVDYACRDDYGMTSSQASAWAGVFYFASRVRSAGEESQSVMTWPEGNGRIAEHLAHRIGSRMRCSTAVAEITNIVGNGENDGLRIDAFSTKHQQTVNYRAKQAIFAAPQFLVPHLVRGYSASSGRDVSAFQYGSWLVANVHLRDRPAESGFPMCWDNVIHGSKSLGYVTSTHQMGVDHGPTVLTWYYPFADVPAKLTRERMLQLEWADWADLVMSDLRVAHADIDSLVSRVDVMCWGHAMIQPRPGFVWNASRVNAAEPMGAIHFAGTDLSGVPLFEEAFYHGVRAAEEILRAREIPHSSFA